jgi:hypothetical protein
VSDAAALAIGVQEMEDDTGIGRAGCRLPPRAEASSETEVASGTRFLAVVLCIRSTVP